jgi:hypothetical protein
LEDLAFTNGVGNFLLCYNLLFGEDFHGIDALGVPFAYLENLSKGSSSDELEEFKITGGQCPLRLLENKVGCYNKSMSPVDTDLVVLVGDLDTNFTADLFIFKRL